MRATLAFLFAALFVAASLRASGEDGERYAFFVMGDPQYLAQKSPAPDALDPYSGEATSRFVELLASLPGRELPEAVGGGKVSQDVLGVVVTGDLIDSADKQGGDYPAMQRFEWARFERDYGLTGEEGALPFPVYELHGNHDGPQADTFVIEAIIERTKTRPGVSNVGPGGLHYSWDWGPLHLVNLGMFVGAGGPRREGHHYAPKGSLEFLRADLEARVGGSGRPVVVSFHLHPDCPEYDWPAEDLRAFWDLVGRYNVVAVFHGHTHGSPPRRRSWNGEALGSSGEGIDVYDPDDAAAAKTDPRDPSRGVGLRHGLLYVELIDRPGVDADEWRVRSCATRDNWQTHAWLELWSKPVEVPGG